MIYFGPATLLFFYDVDMGSISSNKAKEDMEELMLISAAALSFNVPFVLDFFQFVYIFL